MRISVWGLFINLVLSGCAQQTPLPLGSLSDPIIVMVSLNEQLHQWRGVPYRHGGLEKSGIDCSGFVYRTFENRFALRLPRTTEEQARLGTRVTRSQLQPGDLVFFKTGSGNNGLHVGIYHSNHNFIHASTSQGVIKSSLNNVYWKRVYWQSRRL